MSLLVWDASTGAALQQLNGHTDWVRSVTFSHDDTRIVSGSYDKSVRVWDASTGAALHQLNGHTGSVNSVAFSHDGTYIVSGSYDKSVCVWDALTGAALQQLNGHARMVNSVAFSHDGIHIVSGSEDKSVRVWDASRATDSEQIHLDGLIVSCLDATSIRVRSRMHHGDLWTSTVDGWIVSLPAQENLVWLPQGIREVIYHPYNTLIISQEGYAHIDFQGYNVGTQWANCYKPLLV
jgi:WD40 repeat protein